MSDRRTTLHIPGEEKEYSIFPASPFDRRYDLNNGWAKTLMKDLINNTVKEGNPITAGMLIEYSPIFAFNLARLVRFAAYNHHVPGLVDAVGDLIESVIDADINYVQPGTIARLTIYDASNPYHRLTTRKHPDNSKEMIKSVFEDNDYGDECRAAAMKLTEIVRRSLSHKNPETDLATLEARIITAKERYSTPHWILKMLPDALEFLNTVQPKQVSEVFIKDFRGKIRAADPADYDQSLPQIGRAGRNEVYSLA